MSMAETGKGEHAFTAEEGTLPVATFKNSLRLWQARWKAQQASSPASSVKTPAPNKVRGRSKKIRRPARAG